MEHVHTFIGIFYNRREQLRGLMLLRDRTILAPGVDALLTESETLLATISERILARYREYVGSLSDMRRIGPLVPGLRMADHAGEFVRSLEPLVSERGTLLQYQDRATMLVRHYETFRPALATVDSTQLLLRYDDAVRTGTEIRSISETVGQMPLDDINISLRDDIVRLCDIPFVTDADIVARVDAICQKCIPQDLLRCSMVILDAAIIRVDQLVDMVHQRFPEIPFAPDAQQVLADAKQTRTDTMRRLAS